MSLFVSLLIPVLVFLGILFLFVLRLILGQRVAGEVRFTASEAIRPPDAWRPAFADLDARLRALGFEHDCWCRVEARPEAAIMPELIRLYRHGKEPVVARVMPPQPFVSASDCLVTFLTPRSDGAVLATANRLPELFPRPPLSLARGSVTDLDRLEDHWQAHLDAMDAQRDALIPWGETPQMLARLNDFEAASLRWYEEQGHTIAHPDGGFVPSLRTALDFLWRSLRGRVIQAKPETSPLPPDAAALLFCQWRQTQRQAPRPAVQWGFLISTGALFLLAGGLLWDWTLVWLLLAAILLHELGHLLAMRWLGYRNLQIMMLPLLGGVATGVERHPTAANRAFVSLMGPLPGILLGWLLLYFATGGSAGELPMIFAITLLVVNYLNLLPVMPLDGGQLVKALIPPRWLLVLVVFELLGALVLLWLGIRLDPVLALIALIPLLGAMGLWKRRRILSELQWRWGREGGPDGELARIALAIEAQDAHDSGYRPLVKKARAIQELVDTLSLKPPSAAARTLLLGIYLAALAAPLALVPDLGSRFGGLLLDGGFAPARIEAMREEARALSWPETSGCCWARGSPEHPARWASWS